MDWQTCTTKGYAKSIEPNDELVRALTTQSQKRQASAQRLTIDDTTAGTVVCLHYDALRELLEALAIRHGHKIYNHECYTAFLAEQLDEHALTNRFDRLRKTRNAINYYGKDLTPAQAERLVAQTTATIRAVRELLEKTH